MPISLSGSLLITGSLTASGTLTAQTLVVQTVTSSIVYSSGSNVFGNQLTNVQKMTGSLRVTGSGNHYIQGGNVGIGTSSPSAKLEVNDTNGVPLRFGDISTSITGQTAGYIGMSTSAYSGNNGDLVLFPRTSATSNILLMSGSVGIGTSSPAATLQVVGDIYLGSYHATSKLCIGADSNQYLQYNATNDGIIMTSYGVTAFYTGTTPTERMRITSGGKIEMGTTAVTGEIVKVTGTSGSDNYISVYSGTIQMFLDADASNSSGIVGTQSNHNMKLRSNGTNRMNIDTSGNIGAPNSGTNIYNASDIRLKKNITTITNGLDKISALNPVKFNWIDGFVESEEGKDMLGFVAQEVYNIIPEAVESFGGNSLTIGDTIIDNPLRVNEKFIIPVLVKAIQEQQAQIEILKSEIQTLKQ